MVKAMLIEYDNELEIDIEFYDTKAKARTAMVGNIMRIMGVYTERVHTRIKSNGDVGVYNEHDTNYAEIYIDGGMYREDDYVTEWKIVGIPQD